MPFPSEARPLNFLGSFGYGFLAFLILRWIEYATKLRQARTRKKRKPRAAPTQMKTVPCGSVDFCMKGAFAVGGTEAAG